MNVWVLKRNNAHDRTGRLLKSVKKPEHVVILKLGCSNS